MEADWKYLDETHLTAMKDVSTGQHKENRQQNNNTLTTTSRCNFYASKMAISIAYLCVIGTIGWKYFKMSSLVLLNLLAKHAFFICLK